MLKAAWKSVLGHKARLALSTIAIVLGIAFLSGVLSFNHMINATMDGLVSGTTADVNVAPKGTYGAQAPSRDGAPVVQHLELTPADLQAMTRVEGVESVDGVIEMQGVYPLDKRGKVLGNTFAPGLANNMMHGRAFKNQPGLVVTSGRAPEREGEVALDPATLKKGGYAIGDPVKLAFSGPVGTITATIVGTVNFGSGGSAGASYAVFDTRTMQKYADEGKDVYQTAWVVTKPGVDPKQVAQRITDQALPNGFEAVDGQTVTDTTAKTVKDSLSFMTNFLLVFAAIGLIVSVFLIVNTFTILVAQRGRELALFRAMGASRGQVTRSVLFEAIIVGLIGSVLGSIAGLGLALGLSAVLRRMGSDLGSAKAVLDPTGFAACVVVGTLTTILAALMPARRAGRVPPVAAMSGEAMTGTQGLGRRAGVGIGMAVVGLALLATGLWLHVGARLWWIGIGALLTLLGVTLASPILGWPVTWLFGHLYRAVFRTPGRLAAVNATRNPRRTAATASALMIGVTLVSAFAILGHTAENSMHRSILGSVRSQAIVSTRADGGWSDSVTRSIEQTAGVTAVHTYGFATVMDSERKPFRVTAISDNGFNSAYEQNLLDGRVATAPDEIMVMDSAAKERGWKVGTDIPVTTTSKPLTLHVVGIFGKTNGISMGSIFTPRATFADQKPAVQPSVAFVDLDAGQNATQTVDRINDALTDDPLVSAQTVSDFSKSMTANVDQILYILYGLLGVAVIIAIFGIVNTLVLSILERRREIGLLRAVGLSRGQLRLMVGLESVIIAVLGAVLGIGMGLLFGTALAIAAVNRDSFAVPWGQLGVFLALSIIVGILAAIVPSIAASRMHTLRAIAAE